MCGVVAHMLLLRAWIGDDPHSTPPEILSIAVGILLFGDGPCMLAAIVMLLTGLWRNERGKH
jgi:hypothetical protein